jgi:putative transcriptional regulator
MPSFTDRESGMAKVRRLLERTGFFVFDLHHFRPTPFDLIARRDSTLLLVKVLKNVDALGPQDARLLRMLGEELGAVPLVVGRSTGTQALDDTVLYSRHGVGILSLGGLEDYLVEGVPPFLFSSPGGKFIRVDGPALRRARLEHNLSLGAMAEIAGVSRRTIQLYEQGGGAEAEVVRRLEEALSATLAAPLEPFDVEVRLRSPEEGEGRGERGPGPFPPEVLHELGESGWEVTVTVRTPFDALAREERPRGRDVVILGTGSLDQLGRRSRLLLEISRVAEGLSVFLVPDRGSRTDVEGVPVVSFPELRRHSDPDELRELLRERLRRR